MKHSHEAEWVDEVLARAAAENEQYIELMETPDFTEAAAIATQVPWKEMAAKHVPVEINLTSNDLILGVSGKNHPFPLYRQFKVPVALCSDDEGVSRIDLTNEYVRAATTYDLHYADLKNLARTGMEHAFLPGESLWAEKDVFSRT